MSFSKLKSFLTPHWWFFLVALVVFLSYGQTLNMYFWVDDWGMAYKMQHPDANIPNFGPGIFGDGAYRYNVTPFIMLYPLFGLNAYPYFALGLIFYFLASLVVYLLAKELSGKKLVGFISALIFASGYIGSDAMNHLNNSYQLVQTGILSALTVWLLIKHYQSDSKKYYLLAVLLYTAILEFLFLRSHGVFLLILSTSALAVVFYKKPFLQTFLKVTPFFFVWFYMFFLDPRTSKKYDGIGRGDFLPNIINLIVKEKHIELFNNFLITLSSVVFPDETLFAIHRFISSETDIGYIPLALPLLTAFFLLCFLSVKLKLSIKALATAITVLIAFFVYLIWSSSQSSAVWSPDPKQLFVSSWFGSFLVILGTLYFLPILRKRLFLVYFSLMWIVSNVITYFIYAPTTNLASNTRYLIPAFIGTCILFGSIFSMFSKKLRLFVFLPLFIYCGFLISLTNERSTYLVENISNPAREHLKVIKNTVQNMNGNTVFYFDAASGSKFSKSELGGIPHLAIPIELGYEGRANIAVSYDELFFFLKERKVDIGNVHTFFAKGDGLENTTSEFTQLALYSEKEHPIDKWTANIDFANKNICCITQTVYRTSENGTVIVNPILEANLNYPSMLPSLLTLELAVNPMSVKSFNFPLGNLTERYRSQFDENILEKEEVAPSSRHKKEEYIEYLLNEKDRLEFRGTTVKANSNERTREESFINDGKFSFGWEAKSIEWRRGTRPVDLVFSFSSDKRFSKFIWVNHNSLTTPVKYTISASRDGKVWEVIKPVHLTGRKERGEIIVDEFKVVEARYLKISIQDTYGGGNSAPAIDEAWVSQHSPALLLEERDKLLFCPLCQAESYTDAEEIMLFYRPITQARVSWITDRTEQYNIENAQNFSLTADNQIRKYEIILPAQGKTYQKIKLDNFAIPVEVSLLSASIRSLSLNELVEKDLIHDLAD